MRIAVSDYDGTMYHNRTGKLLGDVVGAVKTWREQGNAFVIATGRDYWMIIPEVERWNIPVDYLICINGAAIYNGDSKLLHHKNIPDDLIPSLLKHPATAASMHVQLSSSVEPLRVFLRDTSWFPRIGVNYTKVEYEDALGFTGLGQISYAYEDEEECIGWEMELRLAIGDSLVPHRNKTTIDVNVTGMDKAVGIEELVRINGWQGKELFVIGDGGNDLGMIRKFGGFTVPGAQEEVERAAKRMFEDVPDMLTRV